MLQELTEAEAEEVELRLLSDPAFGEEFDIVVDTIVDEYLDDQLSPEERERAELYFFKSERRREKLEFAALLKKGKPDFFRKRERWRSWTPYLKAAAAIAFVAVAAVVIINQFTGASLNKGLNALHNAYRDERPLESRISGFEYARAPDLRGGPRTVDSTQKELAATIILPKDSDNAGADVHQAIGQYFLTQRKFDEAIDRFQRSLALDPNNSQVHSDLGTALLERGRIRHLEGDSGEENVDFANSLANLNKALELDNSNLEALFNRAILYREMGLLPQSENDWRRYLEKDSTSKWADEAREKLKAIEQQRLQSSSEREAPVQDFLDAYKRSDEATAWNIVRRHYSSDGNTITNSLVDSYLDFDGKGDYAGAEHQLEAVSYLGKLEQQQAGDNYTSDLVQFYKRSNQQQRRNLAHARAQMSQAYDLFLRSQVNDALTYYSQAEQTFRENGSEIEATLAKVRMGHCYWLKPDLKKGSELLTELRESTARSNYRWLFSQSLFRTATIRLTYNDYSESIDYASQALSQSEKMGDFVGTLDILNTLANQYRALGNQKQAWSYLHRAVAMTRDKGAEPLQRWGVNTTIALNLASLGLHEAALEYQQEALRLALDLKPERPLIISRSYDYLAVTYSRLKNHQTALTNIDLAFESSRRVQDQDSGREMMATTLLHRGDIFREAGQFDNAIESYDRSIDLYQQLEYPYYTYPARRGRLMSYLAKGNDVATEAELNSVLQIFNTYRANLKRESQRNTFFNVEQRVYDLAVDFAWSRKRDPELALHYCELSRGRSLLDAMQKNLINEQTDDHIELPLSATAEPFSVAEIKQQTPEDAQIVQYAVLDDKLLMWVVNGNKITPQEKSVSAGDLAERVKRFVRAVGTLPKNEEPSFTSDAKELHRLLIAPIESLLDEKKLICIVPDKVLHYLPFAALVSEASNKYMIEKFRIQLAPSASIFLQGLKDRGQEQGEERMLSVGNPTFDPRAFPSLQPLPAARHEAQTIAELYRPGQSLLLDRNATEQAVRSGMQKANLAHFALHYVVDERHSLYSKMVLTSPGKTTDEANNGLLQIHEIYKMDLAHMRLVVLSACQTAIEQQYGGEGAVSVARPFMAKGVPLVVATLWPVDSSGSEQLMTSFHQYRKQKQLRTPEALQQAQLELIKDNSERLRHPYYWAAFTVIGRYARF